LITLTKPQKILAILYELSAGRSKALSYEQIVVKAFEKYPADFQLRGYPQYPDSSDIHKPLYAMKKRGLIRSANKTFELTPKGLEIASKLVYSEPSKNTQRLTKSEQLEISRITNSDGFHLFVVNRKEEILDTDFYEYLGVSVRTPKNDFVGKLHSVEEAVEAYFTKISDNSASLIRDYHSFLVTKFADEINARM
jgi:hypothetical protein